MEVASVWKPTRKQDAGNSIEKLKIILLIVKREVLLISRFFMKNLHGANMIESEMIPQIKRNLKIHNYEWLTIHHFGDE